MKGIERKGYDMRDFVISIFFFTQRIIVLLGILVKGYRGEVVFSIY